MSDYRKSEMIQELKTIMPFVTGEAIDFLDKGGFFGAPASTKYHGAHAGGLFVHSREVALTLQELTHRNQLEWQRPESPLIVGMFHDLCKMDSYIEKPAFGCEGRRTQQYAFNNNALLKGHGEKSVMLLSQLRRLTEEEIMCIRYHMGAFTDREEWGNYTRAVRAYPNVLWTHQADMIATHVKGV